METTRSILSDRLEAPRSPFPSHRMDETAGTLLADRAKSPLQLTSSTTASNSQQHLATVENLKNFYPPVSAATKSLLLQSLEGTMALLAKQAETSKSLYPLGLESLRPFMPYGSEEMKALFSEQRLERPKTQSSHQRERKEASKLQHSSLGDRRNHPQQHQHDRHSQSHDLSTSTNAPHGSVSSLAPRGGGVCVSGGIGGGGGSSSHNMTAAHALNTSISQVFNNAVNYTFNSSGAAAPSHAFNKPVSHPVSNSSSHAPKKTTSIDHKSQLSNPGHDALLVRAIRELHKEEFGLDVVLLAEGGHVGAHCAVIAAASPFLKTILLSANDHPAIISVTGTSLVTLQALVSCLYTGNIPVGASVSHVIEAANLLKMDSLSSVLQKNTKLQDPPRIKNSLWQGSVHDNRGSESHCEKTGKKVRSNRLDQILYQKLNVNHLAPCDMPDFPQVSLPDPRGGILGELLTKSDPLRAAFASSNAYALSDFSLDASRTPLKPLNLSKPNKNHSESSCSSSSPAYSTANISSTYTTAPSSSLSASSHLPHSLNLSGLSSLAPSLTASMSGLLTSLTPSNLSSMISQSSLVSLASSNALASMAPNPPTTKVPSTSKSSSSNSRSRSKSSGGRSNSRSNASHSNRQSNVQHTLPLLYTLKNGQMTPEVAKEIYEQLRLNPQLASMAGFGNLHNLSSLSSSASLQNLASLHNLSSMQGFPSLFPFIVPTSSENQYGSSTVEGTNYSLANKKSQLSPPSANATPYSFSSSLATKPEVAAAENCAEDEPDPVALNLSSNASSSRCRSPIDIEIEHDNGVQIEASHHSLHSSGINTSVTNMSPKLSLPNNDSEHKSVPELSLLAPCPASTTRVDDGSLANTIANIIADREEKKHVDISINPVKCEEPVDVIPEASVAKTSTTDYCSLINSNSYHTAMPMLFPGSGVTLSKVSIAVTNGKDQYLKGPATVSEVAAKEEATIDETVQAAGDVCLQNVNVSELDGISLIKVVSPNGVTEIISHSPVKDEIKAPTSLVKEPQAGSPESQEVAEVMAIESFDPMSTDNCGVNRKALYHSGHMGRKRKGCGECEGCQVVEDCSQCRFCRDKAKFGGPNRLKQVCVYKRCILAEAEPEETKKRRKLNSKKSRAKCGTCDGCQRTGDCAECYACLHNAAVQPPARRRVCEMRVCEQQQMEEVRAAMNAVGEPSPYSTDSLLAEGAMGMISGTSTPSPDGLMPSTHNDKMKLMRKMLKKKFSQPYSRVSPSKVRTKYYCGECPGCQTNTPCGDCLYCADMPKFGGPGRYRQKCVKQLCVYHPRLQALKLSNRSKITYDELHITNETLSHLGAAGHSEHCDEYTMEDIDIVEDGSGLMMRVDAKEMMYDMDEGTEDRDYSNVATPAVELPEDGYKSESETQSNSAEVEPEFAIIPEVTESITKEIEEEKEVKLDPEPEVPEILEYQDLEEEEEGEEEEEIVSEESDLPSSPSTPSPRPKITKSK